jgi:hypothetical protein
MTPEPRWVCRRPRLDERCRGPQAASEPPQKHGRPCTDGAVTSCARWQNFLGRLGDEWMANAHKSSLEVRSKPGQLIERTSRRHCRRQSARSASMKKCSPSARQRSGIRDDTARKGRGRRKTPARQRDGRREAFPESRSRHKKASPFARKGAHGAPQSSSFRSVRTMRPSPTAISRCSFRVWPYHQQLRASCVGNTPVRAQRSRPLALVASFLRGKECRAAGPSWSSRFAIRCSDRIRTASALTVVGPLAQSHAVIGESRLST